ncbi:hypothetical protein CIK06_23485 [Plantactinospora sp. KBS50]|nr:hypothetical protein CIK06_23485 [Plantactinospora sp. KBS50]
MTTPWETRIADIVDGWLFDEKIELPEVLLVPLENPHLFDAGGWAALGPVRASSGVVAVHEYQGTRVGVAKPVLGAAGCAMLVDAASRRGVRTVLGVGYCGGTHPTLRSGDVVAATSAVTGDGVSALYQPGQDLVPASERLITALGTLNGDRSRLRTGPVHSVGAVHLETQSLVDDCAAAGAASAGDPHPSARPGRLRTARRRRRGAAGRRPRTGRRQDRGTTPGAGPGPAAAAGRLG